MDRPEGSPRRIVLIDFDWRDADFLPGLLRAPGASIRLVAGAGPEDPGFRLAPVCGLARSLEPADLTREIFDLALVGVHSPRREQLVRLLRALGTPVQTPAEFARGADSRDLAAAGAPACDVRSGAEHAAPPDPPRCILLDSAAFTHRLQQAVDRQQAERVPFALYRMTFDGPEAALTEVLRKLPEQLRDADCVCRPAPQDLLLLCAGSSRAFASIRRRVEQLWHETWCAAGGEGTPPALGDERIELSGTAGAAAL